jgi:hypothetical protein
MTMGTKMKRDVVMGAALAALLLAPAPVLAADAMGEVATAQTHAELAGAATDPSDTYMHMHHALNCLVGPGGNGFDAKQMNPCANAGSGAIPDTADPAKKKTLEAVAQLSRDAIAARDPAVVKKDAAQVAARLKAFR